MSSQNRPFRLHLPMLAARSWQEYLDANDGDAERAGKAARADVAERERQNSAARRFVDAYKPLIQQLKLPESPDDPEGAQAQATAALGALGAEATRQLDAAHGLLKDLGIDPAKPGEGLAAAKAKFAEAGEAASLRRENAYAKAATDLKFDGGKLARILRDEPGLPEQRKVKVAVVKDGVAAEEEREVWGIASKDAAGKEKGFTALTEHPDVKGFESALRVTDTSVVTDTNAGMPVVTTAGASAAPAAGAVFKLEGGMSTGNI